MCPGEYYECAILFDRPYLGVSSMHFDILLPGIYVTQFLLHGSPFGFQQSSAIRQHYVCVAQPHYRLLKKTNKQTHTNKQKNKTQRKSKHPGSDLQLICSSLTHTVLISYLILAET